MAASPQTTHLVITDSGLGGLSVCAELEASLRGSMRSCDVQITYVNAWPESGHGYNDLAGVPERARVFDRVLRRIAELKPELLVIACNTLSIVYASTEFHRAPAYPVQGIVDTGVALFHEALSTSPGSSIVLLGTRTTVESDVHRTRLIELGIAPERISSTSCHGLATAIERGPENEVTLRLIDTCAADAVAGAPPGEPLYVGLCCTHYGMVGTRISEAIGDRAGRRTAPLDPNAHLAREMLPRVSQPAREGASRQVSVKVISKVPLSADQRNGVGDLLERLSPATAEALRGYTHIPELF